MFQSFSYFNNKEYYMKGILYNQISQLLVNNGEEARLGIF